MTNYTQTCRTIELILPKDCVAEKAINKNRKIFEVTLPAGTVVYGKDISGYTFDAFYVKEPVLYDLNKRIVKDHKGEPLRDTSSDFVLVPAFAHKKIFLKKGDLTLDVASVELDLALRNIPATFKYLSLLR